MDDGRRQRKRKCLGGQGATCARAARASAGLARGQTSWAVRPSTSAVRGSCSCA